MYIIIIIILFVFFVLFQTNGVEGFRRKCNDGYSCSCLRHARLNDFGAILYMDDKPPSCHGDHSCEPVECPDGFKHGIVCWRCHWMFSEPQNE